MIEFTAVDGLLHYLVTAADGSTKETSVPDTPDNRWYVGWCYRAPLAHQVCDVVRFKDLPYHALFYEQRGRKTKDELDIFRYRYGLGHVDTLVVIAFPNGVHRVWLDELPKDFPPEFLAACRSHAWASGRSTSGKGREDLIELRAHAGPVVLAMNCEAIITDKGWKYLEWFLKKRRVMLVADESAWAAKWSKRTQKLLALGRRSNVVVRAILDGTPVDESPVEIFHPTQFLKPGLLGFDTKVAFRNRYCEYEEEVDEDGVVRRVQKENHRTGSVYDVFKGYRNLDELYAKLQSFSSRIRRADVSDAPAKTYQTRYFQMTDKQRRVYDKLREEYVIELGQTYRVADVLTRMLRLQMVARNYYPSTKTSRPCGTCASSGFLDDGTECAICDGLGAIVSSTNFERIDVRNPSSEALIAELRATRGPVVVWANFRQDVADALEACAAAGRQAFRFDGSVPPAEREAAYQAFRSGEGDAIVATVSSGLQRGRDLSRAVCLIYYSNSFSLRARGQSEDRAEGLDRKISTDIVDLVAEDTRDLAIIEALRAKRSIAESVLGDPPSAWL